MQTQREKDPIHIAKAQPKKTEAASQFITIPVAEYVYLQRLDALMDVLLLDEAYASSHTIQAVKDTLLSMRMQGGGKE